MAPRFLRRLSLWGKMGLGVGLLGIALGAVSVCANWCMAAAADMSRQALATSVQQADAASRVAEQTLQCRRFEKDVFLNLRDPTARDEYRRKWQQEFDELGRAVQEFDAAALAPADHATARTWAEAAGRYKEAMDLVFRGTEDGSVQSPEQANRTVTPFKDSIRTLTTTATETSRDHMNVARQVGADLGQATAFFRGLILAVTAVALVGCLAGGYFLAADLVRPIVVLCDAARRAGNGDWYARADIDREDELGQLADCFNKMIERLRERAAGAEP
jgi:nitrogen fixation/metabolism regulation signal transduction histidine kinase